MRKLFLFDIDGTLIDTANGEVRMSKELVENINALRRSQHITAICSARPLCFVEKLLPDIFDCKILLNGAYVRVADKILIDRPFSNEQITQLDEYFKDISASYIYIGNHSCWANKITPKYKKTLDSIYMVGEGYTKFSSAEPNTVYAVDLFFESISDYNRIFPFIEKTKQMILNYHIGDYTGDISFPGRNKAAAIQSVVLYYGIDKENIYAFGDSINDLEIFKLVPNSCAVGNADPQLKNIASIVSEGRAGAGVLEGIRYWQGVDLIHH